MGRGMFGMSPPVVVVVVVEGGRGIGCGRGGKVVGVGGGSLSVSVSSSSSSGARLVLRGGGSESGVRLAAFISMCRSTSGKRWREREKD